MALWLAASANARPNIVLIVTDDQRWDTLSAMPTVQSGLVARGVTFTNSFVVNPLCCPARASILTGNYSHTTRVWKNSHASRFDDRATIAVRLRRGGYRTAFLGKYLNGYTTTYVPPGWSRWMAFTPSNVHRYFDYQMTVDGTTVSRGTAPEDYSTDVLAEEAERLIRADDDRPLFLAYFPFAPHGPAIPAPRHEGAFDGIEPWRPPSYLEPDISDKPAWLEVLSGPDAAFLDGFRQRQYESLLAVDEAVGRILTALSEARKLSNTLIIFTSDNGLLWGEHRIFGKVVPYEESIRVPLVVRFAGIKPRIDKSLALNVDLAPTIADYAGVKLEADGRSLRPLLRRPATPWRGKFLIESRGFTGFPSPPYCGVRGKRVVYVQYADRSEEIYDLQADRGQLSNLAKVPAWRERRHGLRLDNRALCRQSHGFPIVGLCTLRGTAKKNDLRGTRWFDYVCAGAGADRVFVRDGRRDIVLCGTGKDTAFVDRRDETTGCERVVRS